MLVFAKWDAEKSVPARSRLAVLASVRSHVFDGARRSTDGGCPSIGKRPRISTPGERQTKCEQSCSTLRDNTVTIQAACAGRPQRNQSPVQVVGSLAISHSDVDSTSVSPVMRCISLVYAANAWDRYF